MCMELGFFFFFFFGIRVLVFCTSSDDIDGVKVLFPCTSSDGGLHVFVQSFMKIFLMVSKL